MRNVEFESFDLKGKRGGDGERIRDLKGTRDSKHHLFLAELCNGVSHIRLILEPNPSCSVKVAFLQGISQCEIHVSWNFRASLMKEDREREREVGSVSPHMIFIFIFKKSREPLPI